MMLDDLNQEQLEVIYSEGNLLLTACPGSGKTRVIINKIAWELSKLDPKNKRKILALTFTNRASNEITRRLNRLGALSPEIWSGTIHSFCMEWLIKPYGCYLDELRKGFIIGDEGFIRERVNTLRAKYEIGDFENINMKLDRNGQFSSDVEEHQIFLQEYYQGLKDNQVIDFELLLYYSNRLLFEHPRIAHTLARIFKYILVDEFQDTQDIQYSIISHIVRNSQNDSKVIFVGDTDQAIYDSLGGVAKSFNELKIEIADNDMDSKTLTGNYRSAQRVIDFYRNFQTNDITIHSEATIADEETIITLNNEIDREEIPTEITRLIQYSLDLGIPEHEICVLVPQWWLITSITRRLRQLLTNVSFDASGITPMSRIRDNFWYKMGRLFLTEPSPKMYSIRYRWADEIIDHFKILTNKEFIADQNPQKGLLKLINKINSSEVDGIAFLEESFNELLKFLKIKLEDYSDLNDSWNTYFQTIQNRLNEHEFDVPSDTESFKSFYKENSGIVISTCAGVKGEEFETVIAYGLLHGYLPHWNDIIPPHRDHISASKKLLYVVCSRAKRNLHLIAENGRVTRKGNPLVMNHQLAQLNYEYDKI